jgi:hypothetical protein
MHLKQSPKIYEAKKEKELKGKTDNSTKSRTGKSK